MGTFDHTAVLKQRFDELASGLSELENLRSRVVAAEQMQERHSHEGKPPPTIRNGGTPKSRSAETDRPKRR
ncbi:D-serine deaminase-like pyridoxal phosphate-dependent protein [Bradyrhizobium yuanmingense]